MARRSASASWGSSLMISAALTSDNLVADRGIVIRQIPEARRIAARKRQERSISTTDCTDSISSHPCPPRNPWLNSEKAVSHEKAQKAQRKEVFAQARLSPDR